MIDWNLRELEIKVLSLIAKAFNICITTSQQKGKDEKQKRTFEEYE
jgi:hypothetical protein